MKVKSFSEATTILINDMKNYVKITAKGVKAGIDNSATYPDGEKVVDVAMWNELGDPAKNRPPRPFFRLVVSEKRSSWNKLLIDQIKTTKDIYKSCGIAGSIIASDIKLSIVDFKDPPNAKRTIEIKGFNNPLIHTRVMLNSVKYEVLK